MLPCPNGKFQTHHSERGPQCLAQLRAQAECRRNAFVAGQTNAVELHIVEHDSQIQIRHSVEVKILHRSQQSAVLASRLSFVAILIFAGAAAYVVPRAADAIRGLHDPARVADYALSDKFDEALAGREIEAALAANDSDLAQSFVELAGDRDVKLDPSLVGRVASATAEAATVSHKARSFVRGFVTGEPEDMAAIAGTTLGDLFVIGDIRDALREGARFIAGQKADKVVLGLASAGIAITAASYVTFGAATPARAGLSLVKAARKAGSLGSELAENLGRIAGRASASETGAFERSGREIVKVDRHGGMLNFARDVGRVERAAGGRAAFDALKIAKEPGDMTRVAKLAEKEGSRTRAILKTAGRGAIALAAFALDASVWLLGALFAVLGFVSALKTATERTALRFFRYRRRKRNNQHLQPIAITLAHS